MANDQPQPLKILENWWQCSKL